MVVVPETGKFYPQAWDLRGETSSPVHGTQEGWLAVEDLHGSC
jgi:hypothetical protein